MKQLLFILFLFVTLSSLAQDKPAYLIYDAKGKRCSFENMIKNLKDKEVVLFGELHDDPIAHWMELEVTKALLTSRALMLGAEMIEADNQDALNAYLSDSISQKGLDTLARLWKNYRTDYKPLVDFAKEHKLPFIATNIPRRYASMVNKKGFEALDSLTTKEKSWIAPLPIAFDPELPMYKKILQMMGDHGSPSLVKSQAIKDATMAYFIVKNQKPNTIFLHYNGSYHSDYYEGIVWYLRRKNPTLKCGTISTVIQEDVTRLEKENKGKADFIIVVDEDMTRTF